jgi:uncharacterized protein (TIGR02145 family)
MKFFIILLFLFGLINNSSAQEKNVSNIRVSQEGDKVNINYDLKTSTFISLLVLEDNKKKIGFKISGDIGYVQDGGLKKITLIPENENMVCHSCVFRVIDNNINEGAGGIRIGSQVWSTENLNVSKFRNGDDIPEAKTDEEWVMAGKKKQPAWCYYDYDSKNGIIYGKLYNWYAVIDPRGLAPLGFHIPTDAEWSILIDYLGGTSVAGKKMKSTNGWYDNGNGVNSNGFSGLPGGYRFENGLFSSIGVYGLWWSSTELTIFNTWNRSLSYKDGKVARSGSSKETGLSVRCLRDQKLFN